jgi:hypothetical protein
LIELLILAAMSAVLVVVFAVLFQDKAVAEPVVQPAET